MSRRKPAHNWTNTGSFIKRPQNGWLHPNEQLNSDGVTYGVRFLGSIFVLESMKALDFNTRTAVAKECIHRICSLVYPKASFRKSRQASCLFASQRSVVDNYLADEADLQFAELDVNFTITVDNLSVVREDSGNLLYHHRMQTVSFASGGDGDLIDYIAYVAKDDSGRKCHVMECSGGLANDVITTIGQAFELRFKKHLMQKPSPITVPDSLDISSGSFEHDNPFGSPVQSLGSASCNWSSPKLSLGHSPLLREDSQGSSSSVFSFCETPVKSCDSPSRRDQNSPAAEHIRIGSAVYAKPFRQNTNHSQLATACIQDDLNLVSLPSKHLPYDEPWFHGKISRQECEKRLVHSGDFLVRESPSMAGQFIVSGRHDDEVKHLLLIDPEGRVRTKDQLFTSVSHLINYHYYNHVPILAVDVELLLAFPVRRLDIPT